MSIIILSFPYLFEVRSEVTAIIMLLQALLLSVFTGTAFSQSECVEQPPPLFPIQNVTLGGESVKRGVSVGVGSPPQTMSLSLLMYVRAKRSSDGSAA